MLNNDLFVKVFMLNRMAKGVDNIMDNRLLNMTVTSTLFVFRQLDGPKLPVPSLHPTK